MLSARRILLAAGAIQALTDDPAVRAVLGTLWVALLMLAVTNLQGKLNP